MNEISANKISEEVAKLCIKACCTLTDDVVSAFKRCAALEESPVGREIFDTMIKNAEIAKNGEIPACQDTGMAVVFLDIGQDVHIIGGDLTAAVNLGVRRGYLDGKLRLSVVRDPLVRENTGDNTPAVIHTRIVPGDSVKITVAPKGFGSENMSAMRMFKPSATHDEILEFITECVETAGSNPCPPVIVGVGLGGTIEAAALQAKRALLRSVGELNPNPLYASLEKEALRRINALGIGPQGLGGTITALAVNIEQYATHIAGLPCVVNMGCHITRHASCEIM